MVCIVERHREPLYSPWDAPGIQNGYPEFYIYGLGAAGRADPVDTAPYTCKINADPVDTAPYTCKINADPTDTALSAP